MSNKWLALCASVTIWRLEASVPNPSLPTLQRNQVVFLFHLSYDNDKLAIHKENGARITYLRHSNIKSFDEIGKVESKVVVEL